LIRLIKAGGYRFRGAKFRERKMLLKIRTLMTPAVRGEQKNRME